MAIRLTKKRVEEPAKTFNLDNYLRDHTSDMLVSVYSGGERKVYSAIYTTKMGYEVDLISEEKGLLETRPFHTSTESEVNKWADDWSEGKINE